MKPKIRAHDASRNPQLGLDPFAGERTEDSQFLLVTKGRNGGVQSVWVESEEHALEFLEGLGAAVLQSCMQTASQRPLKAWTYDAYRGELHEIPVGDF
jgi:hypothetical protein